MRSRHGIPFSPLQKNNERGHNEGRSTNKLQLFALGWLILEPCACIKEGGVGVRRWQCDSAPAPRRERVLAVSARRTAKSKDNDSREVPEKRPRSRIWAGLVMWLNHMVQHHRCSKLKGSPHAMLESWHLRWHSDARNAEVGVRELPFTNVII